MSPRPLLWLRALQRDVLHHVLTPDTYRTSLSETRIPGVCLDERLEKHLAPPSCYVQASLTPYSQAFCCDLH